MGVRDALHVDGRANSGGVDILTFELIRNGLAEFSEQMMGTLVRTGRSVNTTQALDCSAGITNAKGELLSQALALPGHMGTFPGVMRAVLVKFGDQIRPGDVYVSNDPYSVGLHLPDIVVVRPVFIEAQLMAFVLTVVHHVDIGGLAAGGMPTYATEVFAEGLRIPLLRLYEKGEINSTLIEFIRKNVRVPNLVIGDLMGQVAACHVGHERLESLIGEYGLHIFNQVAAQLLDYTEIRCRKSFEAWPDGNYRFEDQVDDDALGNGPIVIRGQISVRGDHLNIDFSDTDPQVRGSINCPLHSTFAGACRALCP